MSRQSVPWVSVMRYLGIFIVRSLKFKCSLDAAKRTFYRTANSIFGKIGRSAPEETTLQLIQSKCIPALSYGLEACLTNKSDLRSLDFVLDRFFMKLFRTQGCRGYGDSHGDSHGYGYGMGMGTVMNPHGFCG